MRSLRYLNTVLTIIAVLLTLNLYVGVTGGNVSWQSEAHAAGLPNAGAQRKEMIEHLSKLNDKVAELKGVLLSGEARVVVVSADKDED